MSAIPHRNANDTSAPPALVYVIEDDADVARLVLAALREFGFACEEFGDGAILIRALPADIPAEDAAASLEDLAGRLVETHHADPESARDALLHTMACKAAIKGGWKSDPAELRALVDRVQSGEVKYCPHGRPVAAKITRYELEKLFKRA